MNALALLVLCVWSLGVLWGSYCAERRGANRPVSEIVSEWVDR